MNKTDDQLRDAISTCERLAEVGAILVVVGLIFEVGLAWLFPSGNTYLKKWGPIVTNALIALGVAGEILFNRKARARSEELQRRSDEKIADLETRSLEALERAGDAQTWAMMNM